MVFKCSSSFLVREQLDALTKSSAKKIIILNLDSHPDAVADEFAGYTPIEHLEMIREYAPAMRIDHVLADQYELGDSQRLQLLVESFGAFCTLQICVNHPEVFITMLRN